MLYPTTSGSSVVARKWESEVAKDEAYNENFKGFIDHIEGFKTDFMGIPNQ